MKTVIPATLRFSLFVLLLPIAACGPSKAKKQWASDATGGGNPARGRTALTSYGCISCHTIGGIRESDAMVGPPLTRMASRSYLAGMLENNPANMIRWIQKPREINPKTAMPDLNVTDADARDIASYLYSQE